MLVTVSTFSSDAVNCASGPSKFLHRCCLITRVSSADSTCWSPRITQPFAVSADVGVISTTTVSMPICASLKWFATRRHRAAYPSCSTVTTPHCDHCLTFTLQGRPSVSELGGLLRGTMRTVGVRNKKPVVLRNFTVAPRQMLMNSCGEVSSNVSDSFYNRNLQATGLQQSTHAKVIQRLWSKLRVQMSAPSPLKLLLCR